ncbi:V-type ATP synthase subunit I [Enterococcus montenegrensis]|uniref:V-type ATP synthase subunit I n=1 Tax=Enterococcus montenegrensis TaxID=3031993 RepID=UPI00249EA49C|nr:V-type ATP synthase subunit I [Enterococcus montenegrensis]WHA08107.1 V-type ATP synthase subunit I [Enterococcus montenegrensis]
MAVEAVKKISLILEKSHQEELLQLLQALQTVEITDLVADEENKTWIDYYFPAGLQISHEGMQKYEKLLQQIETALRFVRNHGNAKEKTVELKRKTLDFFALENEFDETKLRKQLDQLADLQNRWSEMQEAKKVNLEKEQWGTLWQSLDAYTADETASTQMLLGTLEDKSWLDFLSEVKDNDNLYVENIFTEKQMTGFALIYLKYEAKNVQELLQKYGVKEEVNPYNKLPKQVLQAAKAQLATLAKQEKALVAEIGQRKKEIASLQLAEEVILAKKEREIVKAGLVKSDNLVVLSGWIADSDCQQFEMQLAKHFLNHEIYYTYAKPTAAEIETLKTPTKLKNAAVVQPFEMLTEMYSLPQYQEIDPTPWLAPFYFVFFGMMVADLGYGLLMLLVTTVALKRVTLSKGVARFMKLFQYLSVSTIIWGLIYGSCFGAELPFYLLSPSKDFMAIFGISMVFGGIQLFTGLFLAAKENIKKKDYVQAVNQGFSWQAILAGIIIAAAGKLVLASEAIFILGIVVAVIGAICVLLIPAVTGKSKVGGFFMGLYELYGVTSYIGDFVSYSRLMALGISGGSIAAAFNMLVGYMPPVARFSAGAVLIIALQGLNIFLSLLSAYVHAARLQYVEFFGKFYNGGGRAFKTFKPTEKYVNFKEENGGKNK